MKKKLSITIVTLMVFSLAGCGDTGNFIPSASEQINNPKHNNVFNEETQRNPSTLTLSIQIGSKNFTAILYNNDSTQALIAKMPLTLNMRELNRNEKYYNLPDRLPTDSQQVGSINTGDLMLYGSDCLVLFYESLSTSYNYTRLGYIEDTFGLKEALGGGNVEVILNMPL